MDHAINALKEYYRVYVDLVREGQPYYDEAKALEVAIHGLERFYYGEPKTATVEEMLRW